MDEKEWDKTMAEYRRKKEAGQLDQKVDDKRNKPLSLKEVDWDSVCASTMAVLVISAIASAVLCYIVYPLVHIFFLCDDFMCGHDIAPGFLVFILVTLCIAAVLGLILKLAEDSEPNKNASNLPTRRLVCSICGHTFYRKSAIGDHVKCPCCGTRLEILDHYRRVNMGRGYGYDNDNLETDYYDSDMEGAPGYYGGD